MSTRIHEQKKLFIETKSNLLRHFSEEQINAKVAKDFSRLEIHAAFNSIKNKTHFSQPIDAFIFKEDLELCKLATLFFLNKELNVSEVDDKFFHIKS